MITLDFMSASVECGEDGFYFKALLAPSDVQQARKFVLSHKSKGYVMEIKQKRESRSLDANAYFWQLLSKLAAALGSTKEELYLNYVRDFGPFRDFTLTQEEAKTFRTAWSMLGVGWPTQQIDYASDGERVVIRAYYGSSTYNTRLMSRMIDSVVEDCKAVGIETLPPEKLSLLKENWNAQRN